MLNHVDTFIFLSGDLEILEALITFASWAHLNIHKKPIGLLNVNNFYDDLLTFINHAIKNHFVSHTIKKTLYLCFYCKWVTWSFTSLYTRIKSKTYALDWSTDDGSSSSSKKCKLDLTFRL